jgi:outer membrane protein OmpA-like peptidoglycan-associated protein
MRIGKALCLLAMMPLAAQAQWAGTTELGILAHYSKLDDDVLLGKTSVGVGGRLGFFALRYLSLEAEYSLGTLDDNLRDASHWRVFRGFVNGHLTLGARSRLIVGAGYKHDTWAGDTTANEYEDGFTMNAGLRFCFGNAWSFRPDVVYDKNPSPNFQSPTTETSRHFSFRVGISRFFGRGHGSCRDASEITDSRPTPPPAAVPPPVTPPPAPAPTATLSASPTSIMAGQSSTLTWSSTNATRCTAPWTTSTATSGTQSVSPTATTAYTITCTGNGGTQSASANVSVAMAAPPPTPPTPPVQPPTQQPPREVFRLEGVFFDFDKSIIKPEGRVKLDSAVTILNRFADMRVEIQGHTDSIGTEQYNVGLSNRRANAVKEYLMSKGIGESRLTTRGFGETSPATSNETAAGRALNRRVILIEVR